MSQRWQRAGGSACIAGIICLLVYLRALSCGFVNYDDPDYVLNNPLISTIDWAMIVQVFREPYIGWWMPLTWLSLAVDHYFWGVNPIGYHLTNIVLHSVNTGLVVLIADRILLGQLSWDAGCEQGVEGRGQGKWLYPVTLLLAGLLWGLHPLRVESVAWVTERKDVLFGIFLLGSTLAYLIHVQKRDAGKRTPWLLSASVVLYACALMSKSVVVVFPAMLLVMDWYPLKRFGRVAVLEIALEKLPFAVLSALMVVATLTLAGDASYLVNREIFPLNERLLVSGNGILEYFRYMVWPAGVMPYHIIPDPIPVAAYTVTSICALILCAAMVCAASKLPWLTAGCILFILPLLPVLGLTQVGDQGFAARFTYLPAVAPSVIAAGLCAAVWNLAVARPLVRRVLGMAVIVLLLLYAAISFRRISDWDNGGTMWTRVISRAPSLSAYWNRAMYYSSVQNDAAAVADYTSAIALATPVWRNHLHNIYAHRGESLLAEGNYAAAVADLTAAIAAYPHPLYFRLRGEALQKLGRTGEAEADLAHAGDERGPLGWYFEPLQEKRGN